MDEPDNLKGVMIYCDNRDAMNYLSDEDAGKLFKAIIDYANNIGPPNLVGPLMAIFQIYKTQIDRNRKHYLEMCQRNQAKARSRWAKIKNLNDSTSRPTSPTSPTASNSMPQHTVECITDKTNRNDNSNSNDNVVITPIIMDGRLSDEDDLSFERAWNLYGKKQGRIDELRKSWDSLSDEDKRQAIAYIPTYIESTPDIRYRKFFCNFIAQKPWINFNFENNNGRCKSNIKAPADRMEASRADALEVMDEFLRRG